MVRFLVVVVSDSVYHGLKKDVSGESAVKTLRGRGYEVLDKVVIPNDPKEIIRVLRNYRGVDVYLFIGGTGPSPRDLTIDTLEDIAWRRIPGFGEFFRKLSFEEIGFRAIISRAELFILHSGEVAVALPGSKNAVETGLKILVEIIDHLIEETRRFHGEHKT